MRHGQHFPHILKYFHSQLLFLSLTGKGSFSRRFQNVRIFIFGLLLGALFATFTCIIFEQYRAFFSQSTTARKRVLLFVSIGSAPRNSELRNAARSTYLKNSDVDEVGFRFFTDEDSTKDPTSHDRNMWKNISSEIEIYGDVVQMHGIPGGYGTSKINVFGLRGLWQMKWALNEYDFHYYLRIDDDSYLCLERLLFELSEMPRSNLFWGRFWCRPGRNRADESFMLWSKDVVEWIVRNGGQNGLVPWDNNVTLGWNWGFWSWVLNLTIIDDQKGIDSQQGYLTRDAHIGFDIKEGKLPPSREIGDFCGSLLFAHHVKPSIIQSIHSKTRHRLLYSRRIVRKGRACRSTEQSFLPGRHSKSLPQIRIQNDDPE